MTFHSWSKSTCAALVLVLSCLLGPSAPASLPSANTGSITQDNSDSVEIKSLRHPINDEMNKDENFKNIVAKIKTINENLVDLSKSQVDDFNHKPEEKENYVIDKDTLDTMVNILYEKKLESFSSEKENNENYIEDYNPINDRFTNQRALEIKAMLPNTLNQITSGAYMVNLPVVVVPFMNYNAPSSYRIKNDMSFLENYNLIQTKQNFELPFKIPWPLAPIFPIVFKDPLVALIHGGGWEKFVEYGQQADVCSRKQKRFNKEVKTNLVQDRVDNDNLVLDASINSIHSRKKRAIKKRTVSPKASLQEIDNPKKLKKNISDKAIHSTRKPVSQIQVKEENYANKYNDPNDSKFNFPFGEWPWFSNKKPTDNPPGFFINRLRVRKGGVAIAGPGGVATAGRGGTAIVGPGGLAYTQPGSLAVAGPAASIVALTPEADLNSVTSRLQKQAIVDRSIPRLLQAIPEGKVVATGPIIFYHPT